MVEMRAYRNRSHRFIPTWCRVTIRVTEETAHWQSDFTKIITAETDASYYKKKGHRTDEKATQSPSRAF